MAKKGKLAVSLTQERIDMVREYAERMGVPMSAVVSLALARYFESLGLIEKK